MAPAGNGVPILSWEQSGEDIYIFLPQECNVSHGNVDINRYPLLINLNMWPAGSAGEPPVLPLLSKLELSQQKNVAKGLRHRVVNVDHVL